MGCNNRIYLESLNMKVECGKCRGCRKKRAIDWTTRIAHESYMNKNNVFVTLTYDDRCMPINMGLKKEDVVGWMKRLRKRLQPRKIKYFIVGEYGEKKGRPHYHCILFNVSRNDFIFKRTVNGEDQYEDPSWMKGFLSIGYVNVKTARYIVQYLTVKRKEMEKYERMIPGREKVFCKMSNGMGLSFINKYGDNIKKNLGLTVGGHTVGLPRYYREKLGIDGEELKKRFKDSEYYKKIFAYFNERGFEGIEIEKEYNRINRKKEQNMMKEEVVKVKSRRAML